MTTLPATFEIFRVFIAANRVRFQLVCALLSVFALSLLALSVIADNQLFVAISAFSVKLAGLMILFLVAFLTIATSEDELARHGYHKGHTVLGLRVPDFLAPEENLSFEELSAICDELNDNPIY